MNFVAVNDQSVWFQVEIPLVVEKSVSARAGQHSSSRATAATSDGDRIVLQFPIRVSAQV
jgi:hypothetical protein